MKSDRKSDVPVRKGTTILQSTPFAYCLKSDHRGKMCDYCLKPNAELRRCTGCFVVSYCDTDCQRSGWIDHKGECHNMARVKPNVPTDSVRLIGRIILKLQKGGDTITEAITSTRSRKFKDLMSHYKEIKEDAKRMEHFLTICAVLNEYLKDAIMPNSAELLGIYGRVCVNSFNIVNGEMQAIGTGIYLAPSIIDHSCAPNTVVTFDGFHLRVQMMEDVPSLNWDAIRISYIDLMSSRTDRMKELKKRYYFDCDCPRCHSDTIVDRHQYAAKCPDCDNPITVKKGENFPPCTCGYTATQERELAFWKATEYSEQQLALMQETNYLDICKMCLEKQGNLFHDLCLVRCKMLDAAFDAAIQLGSWESATEFGVPLVSAYKLWYGPQHPLTAILLLKLFKILMLSSPPDPLAFAYYEEAVSIIELTHGKSSSFYCREVKPLIQQFR